MGIKCGEKKRSTHWRGSKELSQSNEFIENFQILEQAHERLAWVHGLSALPNISSIGNVEQGGRLRIDQNTMSVHEEVTALLSDQFPSADYDLLTSVVSEEVQRYEETKASGIKLAEQSPKQGHNSITGPGIISPQGFY